MRQLFIALVLLCHVVNIASADQADAEVKPGGPRVRPNDSLTARLLREGLARSSTLRRLVNQIEERDVIVYLEMQPRIKREHAGCVTWMHATSTYRYVRASLNPDLSRDQLIATIAHELQHVLEIAEQPRVADASTLLELYRTIGEQRQPGSLYWDTSTAREAGNAVRRELASAQAAETAGASGRESVSSLATFHCASWVISSLLSCVPRRRS